MLKLAPFGELGLGMIEFLPNLTFTSGSTPQLSKIYPKGNRKKGREGRKEVRRERMKEGRRE